jgi:hypothetical protein
LFVTQSAVRARIKLLDLKQGRLYPIADAPVIECNAFVVFWPGQETRGEIRQALDLLRRVVSR